MTMGGWPPRTPDNDDRELMRPSAKILAIGMMANARPMSMFSCLYVSVVQTAIDLLVGKIRDSDTVELGDVLPEVGVPLSRLDLRRPRLEYIARH